MSLTRKRDERWTFDDEDEFMGIRLLVMTAHVWFFLLLRSSDLLFMNEGSSEDSIHPEGTKARTTTTTKRATSEWKRKRDLRCIRDRITGKPRRTQRHTETEAVRESLSPVSHVLTYSFFLSFPLSFSAFSSSRTRKREWLTQSATSSSCDVGSDDRCSRGKSKTVGQTRQRKKETTRGRRVNPSSDSHIDQNKRSRDSNSISANKQHNTLSLCLPVVVCVRDCQSVFPVPLCYSYSDIKHRIGRRRGGGTEGLDSA